jgi:hypothetical protein
MAARLLLNQLLEIHSKYSIQQYVNYPNSNIQFVKNQCTGIIGNAFTKSLLIDVHYKCKILPGQHSLFLWIDNLFYLLRYPSQTNVEV